jgi:hypothetical protein
VLQRLLLLCTNCRKAAKVSLRLDIRHVAMCVLVRIATGPNVALVAMPSAKCANHILHKKY